MNLITFKIFSAIGICLISISGGFLTLLFKKNRFFSLGNCFVGGFFLTVSLRHMLSESIQVIDQHAFFLCLFGLMIPLFIDTFMIKHSILHDNDKKINYLKGEAFMSQFDDDNDATSNKKPENDLINEQSSSNCEQVDQINKVDQNENNEPPKKKQKKKKNER